MLNLDQIKQLEARVSKAIELMQTLKDENDLLKLELHDRQQRIEELENIVLVFRNDQAKIEEGIINALNHLSAFEDTVYQAANSAAASAVHETAPAANEYQDVQSTASSSIETAAPEQPSAVHQEASEAQYPAAAAETAPQLAPQEPVNHSNQLDIF
ncbi:MULTISPECIES: cell division protein ZapB [unclassified Treponema]|uniref:cell division protein ZapB n=1 Tax=unclassified Treponema TaxID=2638727 RepID=UPI0005300CBD|nr:MULTISPECIES: cell division protein ZapB [unclassified Treponema]AIW89053.1 hypothetical protein JO41_03880 [Treponema sp. OMZ 838]UTC44606.1 hypothetical protein E4N66_11295 [Treponema sp. OMZ 857]